MTHSYLLTSCRQTVEWVENACNVKGIWQTHTKTTTEISIRRRFNLYYFATLFQPIPLRIVRGRMIGWVIFWKLFKIWPSWRNSFGSQRTRKKPRRKRCCYSEQDAHDLRHPTPLKPPICSHVVCRVNFTWTLVLFGGWIMVVVRFGTVCVIVVKYVISQNLGIWGLRSTCHLLWGMARI